jgi:hypothetical protein
MHALDVSTGHALDEPDFVRREIADAMKAKITVVLQEIRAFDGFQLVRLVHQNRS